MFVCWIPVCCLVVAVVSEVGSVSVEGGSVGVEGGEEEGKEREEGRERSVF